jgi:DNA-binding GntR family transcriptional regulator
MTLKESAYLALRRKILHAELEPGSFVSERSLGEVLGMSRSPIRSALERLEADGLVKYSPQKGILITELSLSTAVDLFDFRLALEPFIVRRLATRGLAEKDLDSLHENLEVQVTFINRNDPAEFTQADSQFHLLLANATGNREIAQAMERIQDRLYRVALAVLQRDSERLRPSFEDHHAILNALQARDLPKAESIIQTHLEYGKSVLLH